MLNIVPNLFLGIKLIKFGVTQSYCLHAPSVHSLIENVMSGEHVQTDHCDFSIDLNGNNNYGFI